MFLKNGIVLLVLCSSTVFAELEEVFEWKQVKFEWPNEEAEKTAIDNGDYVPENNLPLGMARWKDKLFVTFPRSKRGVAASLNYILLNTTEKSPTFHPYPDWTANLLPKEGETPVDNQIVSVFRIKVDPCDRLWIMETGLADYSGNPKQVIPPSITIFDLNTDTLIKRYNLSKTDISENSFFANIIVDVTNNTCDKAFAYVPDMGGYGIVVYSLAEDKSWKVKHNYFHPDPLKGDMTVGGVNFQWIDGVIGIALGPVNETTGFRTAYFHAMISSNEFSVSTQVLKNEVLGTDPASFHLYQLEGVKDDKGQSTSSDFDVKTNVLFMTQLQRDGVACWNPRTRLEPNNFPLIVQDHEKLIFPNDVSIDDERNLWILSDRISVFIYSQLNPNEVNYRIMKIAIDDAIKGTACDA